MVLAVAVLLIAAVIVFGLVAFGVPSGRINLLGLGLALFTAAFLLPTIHALQH
jgi:hypothetical protein